MVNSKVNSTVQGSYVRILRNGKLRHEILLQRGIAHVNSLLGEKLSKNIVVEPVGMHLGKKTGNVFTTN